MAEQDAELETFRGEARAWLTANFPKSLAGKAALAYAEGEEPIAALTQWKKTIGAKGWATPTWPAKYGAGGLSPAQAAVLREEMEAIGAFNPLMLGMGITMVGPTILDYGTEEQKARHIPPIVRGEVRWCIGYSEPNAGSDLASLQTRAVDVGDEFVVNGQKIWTSGAQYADWCGALVRTDPKAKKHDGISFLLTPMHQPGVETRPIALIAGASPFCETFFTDAKARKDDLLGELNRGWSVGKRLLQHERASQTGNRAGPPLTPLDEVAKRYAELDDNGQLADRELRARLADHLMHAQAHALTLTRVAAESRGNTDPSNAASVLKTSATILAQTRAELTIEMMGTEGLGWEGEGFSGEELEAVRTWLAGKAMSIYGGSAEIQNNIISKRILGLPDATGSS